MDFVEREAPSLEKTSASKPRERGGKPRVGSPSDRGAGLAKSVQRDAKAGQFFVSKARFEAIMRAAEQSGLLSAKSGRIAGRVSPALVEQAKRQTGIETDTDLIAFALATIALEDNFAAAFVESRGKVDPELKLGF